MKCTFLYPHSFNGKNCKACRAATSTGTFWQAVKNWLFAIKDAIKLLLS